jgi:hypothetical protein
VLSSGKNIQADTGFQRIVADGQPGLTRKFKGPRHVQTARPENAASLAADFYLPPDGRYDRLQPSLGVGQFHRDVPGRAYNALTSIGIGTAFERFQHQKELLGEHVRILRWITL